MSDINVGSVSVSVVPSADRFFPDLRAKLFPEADRLGRDIAARIASPITDAIVRAVVDGGAKARAAAAQGGSASGGAFADTFRTRVTAALRDLPTPRVGVDATEADAELADIRARLQALGDVNVGVDLQAADAIAELDSLKVRIDELGAKSPDVNVQVDAVKASAELAAVRAEVDALDGETAHVDVDTSAATASISTMTAALVGVGPALIPIAAVAAAGIGGIVTAAAAGVAGLGVLTLGLSAVTSAVGLLGKQRTAVAQEAARSASAAGAQAAAEVTAANQVASATASLAQARRTAAQQEISASEAVTRAQYAKTQADQQEAAAQHQLNDAREQAVRDLESASNRAIDAQLAAKQAAIDVTNAEANYVAVVKNAKSTQLQRQQAALDLAKAQQALKEANQQATQAAQDNNAAQKAGVNGAPAVLAAAQAVTNAKHGQQAAGQALTDAERAQAAQREQAAFTIEQAQRSLSSALDAQAKAARGSGTAGSSALALINAQLAKTNPAVLAFAGLVTDKIEPAFKRLKDAAAAGLLPGVEAGLKALAPLFRPFAAFVSGLAGTMGDLFAAAGKALTSPFWRSFFDYVSATAGPTLATMGRIIGDVVTGFAGLIQAFAPFTKQIGDVILRVAGSFATFGEHLGTNGPFQSFLAYIRREGPVVADFIGKVFDVIGKLLPILAPFGDLILKSLDMLAGVLAKMSPAEILGIGSALAVAFGGPVLQVAAIAAALAYAYEHSEAFRKVVKTLAGDISRVVLPVLKLFRDHWGDIKKAIGTVIDWISVHVGPVLEALGNLFVAVVGTIRDLWDRFGRHLVDHLKTAFDALAEILSGAFKVLQGIFEIFTGILTGKWSKVWRGLKDIVDGIWKIIQGTVREALNAVSTIIGASMAVVSEIWSKAWALLKTPVLAVVHFVTGSFDDVVGFFTKMPGRIAKAATGMWDGISGAFKSAIDTIIGWWDTFVGYLKIPGFSIGVGPIHEHFGGIDIGKDLHIPYLASGGVAQAATLGVFGEAGREAILPLTDPNAMKQIADAIGAHGGKQPLIGEYNVYNPRPERQSRDLPKAMRRAQFALEMS